MKEKRWTVLFCVLFGILCLTPGMGMLILGPSQAASNEVLAKSPALRERDGSLNLDFFSDGTAYFEDHFALRQEMVTANAVLTASVFQESAAQDVILGSGGWLYYADTLADFEGTTPMSRRQLWCAAHTLALIQEYVQGQGGDFVFTVAPNKNTLYPDFMPKRYQKSESPSNLELLAALLAEENVTYCDLLTVLRQEEQPVYYRTDSHWTGYGSALAHDALLKTLGRDASLAQEAFVPADHLGDLYEMLYPAGNQTESGLSLARARTFAYEGTVRGADDMTIRTVCQGQSGSLLMFRDSFGNTLHADLAESFANACFSRAMPYDLTQMEEEQADTVVIEIVERNLVKLATEPPVLPGPARELTLPEKAVPAHVQMDVQESAVKGCVHYTGTVQCGQMDEDSPIYLALDGVVYEAAPVGKGENAFSLYAPAAAQIDLLAVCGGTLVRCERGLE